MKLLLVRKTHTPKSTIGELFTDGEFFCFTLERPLSSIKGAASPFAIPNGTYTVKMRWSNRWQRMVPGVENVPGRADIEMHIGNYPENTEGCILVGQTAGVDEINHSKLAFEGLMRKLGGIEDVTLTVREQ